MKRFLFIISTLFCTNFYSQYITVSGATSTPQQLANRIVNTNCVTTSNWIVKSGSDYAGNPNSVGTFSNTATNTFPLSEGIVLTTGSLTNAPGPKTLPNYIGDGDITWLGDSDMNSFLGQSSFINASSLQFDFTTTSNTFKLNYIFASEEYGNNQCDALSDVVIILLKDMSTGVITNIASTPALITPINIRKNIYNTNCLDVNPNSFGSFYGGSAAFNAPINYFGRTIPLTATATVDPTHTYKLKIVIADRSDFQYDSAIFIGNYNKTLSNQDLFGPNLVSANNTALCEGVPYTLNTNLSPSFSYIWKKDGVVISGQTSSSYTIPSSEANGTHDYNVISILDICNTYDAATDIIKIEFVPPVTTPDPIDLYNCAGGSTSYDFNVNSSIISQGLTYIPIISYHTSLTNATNNTGALPFNYTGTVSPIFVRIAQPGNPCPAIKQFNLGTLTIPVTATAPPLLDKLCGRSTTIQSIPYKLDTLNPTILGSQSPAIYGVSYHSTPNGALTDTDLIPVANTGYSTLVTSTVYIRVYVKSNPDCFAVTSFNVTVNPLLAADKPEDVAYCAAAPGYKLPPLVNGHYFPNKYVEGVPNSQGTEIPAGTYIVPPSGFVGTYTQTIYVSNLKTTANPCSEENELKITLIQPTTFSETSKVVCDTYSLPNLDYGDYWTEPNGTGTIILDDVPLTTTTTVYYYFQSTINTTDNPSCTVGAGPVTISFEYQPDLGPDRPNVFTCNPPYILPSLAAYPGAKYYTGPNGTGTVLADGAQISATQDIYIYIEGTGTLQCPNEKKFTVVVGLLTPLDINECTHTLPTPVVGEYWTESHYPLDGSYGTQLPPGYQIEQSLTVYLYVPFPTGVTTCATGYTNEVSYFINVSHPPVDDIPSFVSPRCDPFTLNAITNGKYYTEPHNLTDGTGGGSIIPFGTVLNPSPNVQTVYVYNSMMDSSGNVCAFEKKFDFVINPKPIIDARSDNDECTNDFYDLPPLANGNYYTGPLGTGQLLTSSDLRIFAPDPKTFYVYNADPVTGCNVQSTIRITFPRTLCDIPTSLVELCANSYQLPPLTNGKYYEDPGGPQGPNNPQPSPPIGVEITGAAMTRTIPVSNTLPYYDDTVYAYASTLDGIRESCIKEYPSRIILYKKPNLGNFSDMYFCGQTPITGSDLPATTGKYYTESHLGGGTGGTEITATTPITSTQKIYVYENNPSIISGSTFSGCDDEKSFTVNILKVDTVSDLTGCGSITLPALTVGNYYDDTYTNSPNQITNTTITNTGTTILTKRIYIYKASGFPAGKCDHDETFFDITITPIPTANTVPPSDLVFCDSDTENDGVLEVDLTQYTTTILGSQTGTEFSVTYHETIDDANNNVNSILKTKLAKVYAVVHNSNFSICSSVPLEIVLTINKLPEPNLIDGYICMNNISGLPISTYTIDSHLNTNHTFEWKDGLGTIIGAASTFTATVPGDYSLTATNSTTGCVSEEVFVTVLPSSIAITGYSVTENFVDNQVITVVASGYGGANDAFLYQLDGGLFQESNIFENVASGQHTVIVRDKYGCGDSAPFDVLVVNYPKFFTPNGDGFNDYWNISDLNLLDTAKISIYNREGKLVKQISTSGIGWDGNFNGVALPASDYWFAVNYTEDGLSKEFKSHFTLKR